MPLPVVVNRQFSFYYTCVGSSYQPMEVLTAVVSDASPIHPTATAGVTES